MKINYADDNLNNIRIIRKIVKKNLLAINSYSNNEACIVDECGILILKKISDNIKILKFVNQNNPKIIEVA